MKTAIVLVSDGTEEMEAVITIDILRRASVNVTVASINSNPIVCARQTKIVADEFDLVVLPGGLKGAEAFATSKRVQELLRQFEKSKKWIAVICASAIALDAAKVGYGKTITSHPSVKATLDKYNYSEQRVVVSDHFVTSRGPGTSFEFALQLVELLCGQQVATKVAEPMMMYKY